MSNPIKDGGSAFPQPATKWKDVGGKECVMVGEPGMSLRDYFAGQALAGMQASREYPPYRSQMDDTEKRSFARHSYNLADAMIAAREAKP